MTVKHLYPAVEPSLNLDFANSKRLDSRITFTRGSTGTYTDESGIIRTAAANEARFDHDSDGNSLGLLLEESRTNYCTYSQIDSTNWTQANTSSLSASAVTAPDGGTCYDLTTDSGGPNSVRLASNSSPSGTVVLSVFARFPNSGFTALNVRLVAVSGGANFYADFYPATESFSGEVNCQGSFEKFPNGWYKLTVVSTVSSGAGSHEVRFGGGIGSSSFTQETCQIWGAQLEAGSFPTSYIPTSGSTVTRSADVASMTGTNFSSWYNQSEGTIVSTAAPFSVANNSFVYAFLTGNSYRIEHNVKAFFQFLVYNNAVDYSANIADYSINQANIAALAYKTNSANCALNGTLGTEDTSVTIPSVSSVNIGNNSASARLNGTISRLTYYPTRLPDATLQALTL
jgi:hypothetical protein